MARYPTLSDYQPRGNYTEGITRCNDLLKKSPNDIQLLTVKLQLLYASGQKPAPVLEQLVSLKPPVSDLRDIVAIEEACVEGNRDVFPQPASAGPEVARLWDAAFKAPGTTTNYKLDLLSLRFSRAVIDNRLADAQQALIQLKALQPRNRVAYMAHCALTQLLSREAGDLQARLALSLARKAVSEGFEKEGGLDCRVPGQVFAVQGSAADLEGVKGGAFGGSREVLSALREGRKMEGNGVLVTPKTSLDPSNVPPAEWLSREVESLEQRFATLLASSTPSAPSLDEATAFSANCIRLFHTASAKLTPLGNSRSLANAAFLTISTLIHLSTLTPSNPLPPLLHAAFLAETLLTLNPHTHEARLILVYLYTRLNLGTLALRLFDSLNIKEIQHDTVGHALFTYIATLHPHELKLGKRDTIDPFKRTGIALRMYTRHEEKLAETEAGVLSHGQTGMIFDVRELRDKLRSSLTRRIVYLEHRRLDRLLHPHSPSPSEAEEEDVALLGPRVLANWLHTTDNRDFAGTFSYAGFNVEKVLHAHRGLADAVLPGRVWILYALAAECAWCMACGDAPPIKDVENLLQELAKITLDIDPRAIGETGAAQLGLTDAEFLAGDLSHQVLQLLVHLQIPDSATQLTQAVESVRHSLERLPIPALLDTKDVFAERLQDCYVYLDILRIVVKAISFAGKRAEGGGLELGKVREVAEGYLKGIQAHARERAKCVDTAEVKRIMKDDGGVYEAVMLFGEREMDGFCKAVAESAKAGWGGLARIQGV